MSDASAAVSSVSVSTARSTPKAATALGVGVGHQRAGPPPGRSEPGGPRGRTASPAPPARRSSCPAPTGIVVAVGLGDRGAHRRQRPACRGGIVRPRRRQASLARHHARRRRRGRRRRPPGRRSPRVCCSASYRYVGLKTVRPTRLEARERDAGGRREAPEAGRCGRRARRHRRPIRRRSPASWPTPRRPT